MRNLLFFALLLFGMASCVDPIPVEPGAPVEGLRPVYADGDWKEIAATTPKPIGTLGKIYYKDETIYAVEQFEGIHVIDNSNPENPLQTAFLKITGVRDIAIKGDIMYVDNATDLVSLDVSNVMEPTVLSRVADLYPNLDQTFPQGYEGPFECVDESMGLIIGWETATLDDPKCWR
ncbi:MAG: hypothetical protein GYB31_14885 [Bacteroidetes bacterium]|nr:hypothetical protein [Bacteroidota bacterium]